MEGYYKGFASEADLYFDSLPEEAFFSASCPICSGGDSSTTLKSPPLEQNNPYLLFTKGQAHYWLCPCGLVFNRHQAKEEYLIEFYKTSQAMKSWDEIKTKPHEISRQKEKFGRVFDFIANEKIESVLDVGCGTGLFLDLVKWQYPSTICDGIEFRGPRSANVQDQSRRYDLITFWGVIEHAADPVKLVSQYLPYLSERGHILICVPNLLSPLFYLAHKNWFSFCNQHLWFFTPYTLDGVMKKAGHLERYYYYSIEEYDNEYKSAFLTGDPYRKDLPRWIQTTPFGNYLLSNNKEGNKFITVYRRADA